MSLGRDSALSSLIHPRLHDRLGLFFPTIVEVQQSTVTYRPNGEQVKTWQTFLVCGGNLAPLGARETRGETTTDYTRQWGLNLAGRYPSVQVNHRVKVLSSVFNVVGVIHDSLGESTRLDLEVVDV